MAGPKLVGEKAENETGPGEYYGEEAGALGDMRKDAMREYQRQLAAARDENARQVKERKKKIDLAREAESQATGQERVRVERFKENAHGFNSTEDRRARKRLGEEGIGPGMYNPISNTIMEKVIKVRMEKEKAKVN